MIKLYGTSMSRAARCLWALEELGVQYEHVPTAVADAKGAELLKVNPNGHIPTLDDNGTVLWESMAINLYLAEKYGKAPLWPASVEDHGRASQWSFWGMTEVEPHLMTILRNRLLNPPEQRNEKAAEQAVEALGGPCKVLNDHLSGSEFMLGKDFTIADLNAASVMSFALLVKLDLSAAPAVQAWLRTCLGREANKKVRGMK